MIYLISFPRSGSHWLRALLSLHQFPIKSNLLHTHDNNLTYVHHGPILRSGSLDPSFPSNFILCVSSFEPNKNIPFLIESFSLIASHWEGELILAGRNGRDLQRSLAKAREVELDSRIRFVVDPDERTLGNLYHAADLFVFPSLYEGFGFPVLEALSTGLPIVSSNRAASPEVLGDAGISADPESREAFASAMREFLENNDLQDNLRLKSIRRTAEFSWARAAKETWNAILLCLEDA